MVVWEPASEVWQLKQDMWDPSSHALQLQLNLTPENTKKSVETSCLLNFVTHFT